MNPYVQTAVNAFLLAFPALISIVNPFSGALIFRARTDDRTHAERAALAKKVGMMSFLVMLVSLTAGARVLAFFGVSLAALRIGGGTMVAFNAWTLINAPERQQERKQQQLSDSPMRPQDDVALFPLTIPFTTGPGTMAVAITLGSAHPADLTSEAAYYVGASVAAAAIAVSVWASYAAADRLASRLGEGGSKTFTRLFAFLLLCIGVQIALDGVKDVLRPMLAAHP